MKGSTTMNTIGELVSQKRKENRLTQKELADLLHLTPSAISKWENDIAVPHISQFPQIAEALQIPVADLYALTIDDFRYVATTEDFPLLDSSENNEQECNPNTQDESSDNNLLPVSIAHSRKNRLTYVVLILLILALILIGLFIAPSLNRTTNTEPSVTIVDEYFCDDKPYFDYTDIYYVIVEYDGTITEEFLQSYEPIMREEYGNKFSEASIILIYFYDNYSGFESNDSPEMKLVLLPSVKR